MPFEIIIILSERFIVTERSYLKQIHVFIKTGLEPVYVCDFTNGMKKLLIFG